MKRTSFLTILALIVTTVLIGSFIIPKPSVAAVSSRPTYYVITKEVRQDELSDYFYALGLLEASGNYKARRTGSQYIGMYQIGNSARTVIGLSHLNNESGYEIMLNDPTLQDMIAFRVLQTQISYMIPYIKKYENTKVGSWYVTSSGIIAMSHLLGHKNAQAFLDSNGKTISKDGNGRPITDYLQLNGFYLNVDSILNDSYAKRFLTQLNN